MTLPIYLTICKISTKKDEKIEQFKASDNAVKHEVSQFVRNFGKSISFNIKFDGTGTPSKTIHSSH